MEQVSYTEAVCFTDVLVHLVTQWLTTSIAAGFEGLRHRGVVHIEETLGLYKVTLVRRSTRGV